MISMTVGALECVWIQFAFFCLKARGIDLLIHFAIPHKLMVVLSLLRAIILDVFGSLDMAGNSCMSPSPAVLALRNSQIHISSSNGRNESPYIKASIN